MPENNNQANHYQQQPSFLNGLVVGMAAGAAAYFLFATKKGNKIRDQILKNAREGWKDLSDVVEKAEVKGKKLTEGVQNVQNNIETKAKQAQTQITKEVSKLQTKVEAAKKKADKAQEDLKKAAEKIEKRFFTKGGRSLGK